MGTARGLFGVARSPKYFPLSLPHAVNTMVPRISATAMRIRCENPKRMNVTLQDLGEAMPLPTSMLAIL